MGIQLFRGRTWDDSMPDNRRYLARISIRRPAAEPQVAVGKGRRVTLPAEGDTNYRSNVVGAELW
jgi:hypothetical protein